tara:strand:+ start:261 stop:461 length:201 start_codon:yes stop_codon:yes gene_type:complete
VKDWSKSADRVEAIADLLGLCVEEMRRDGLAGGLGEMLIRSFESNRKDLEQNVAYLRARQKRKGAK